VPSLCKKLLIKSRQFWHKEQMKYTFQKESAMELRPLRFLALWPHKASMEECLLDVDFLNTTHHFSLRNERGNVLACCTIVEEAKMIEGKLFPLRLRAMAVHPDFHRKGLGKMLLKWVEQNFPEKSFWCDARLVAVPFYSSCGWEVKSEEYLIPVIGPHYLMVKG